MATHTDSLSSTEIHCYKLPPMHTASGGYLFIYFYIVSQIFQQIIQ